MKIDNVVRIVDGVLHTTPSIDAFERVVFDVNRVLRGDLFIDTENSAQATHEACEKGAYAIISTRPFEGDDSELAWICVSSLEQALIKLLRYHIAEKSLHCVLFSPLQASFFEMLHSPKSVKILQGSLIQTTQQLFRAKEGEWFGLIDPALCQQIAPSAFSLEAFVEEESSTSKGLFLSSFWHHERYCLDQKLPSLFKPDCLAVLRFCDTHAIAYTLENLNFTEHFYPQFVTPNLRKKEFGSSDKVLIFEPSEMLLETEIAYLQMHCEAKQWLLVLPKSYHNTLTCEASILRYALPHDISLLKELPFLYALILGDKEAFEPLLNQSFINQPCLF